MYNWQNFVITHLSFDKKCIPVYCYTDKLYSYTTGTSLKVPRVLTAKRVAILTPRKKKVRWLLRVSTAGGAEGGRGGE